jgi:hypothetical protein
MKKNLIGPIVTAIIMVLIAAVFVYFYVQLNRLDKKMMAMQTTIIEDSNKTAAVVNFLNTNLNAQNNQN